MIFKKTKVSQARFAQESSEILKEVSEILIKKNRMYGGASMDLGMVGTYVHLHDKVSRLKQLVEIHESGNPDQIEFEGIEDTLRDMIGYATIGLVILNAQTKELKKNLPESFQYPVPKKPIHLDIVEES